VCERESNSPVSSINRSLSPAWGGGDGLGSRVVASLTRKIVGTLFFFFPTVESVIVKQAKSGLVPTPQVRLSLTQLETRELDSRITQEQNDFAQVYTMEKT